MGSQSGSGKAFWCFSFMFMRMAVIVNMTVFRLMFMVIRQRCERSCSVSSSLSSDSAGLSLLLEPTLCGGRRGWWLLRDSGWLQLGRGLLVWVDGRNACDCLHSMDMTVFVITLFKITMLVITMLMISVVVTTVSVITMLVISVVVTTVSVITVVVIIVRLSRWVLTVRVNLYLLMFVLFVMCVIMIMCVLHMSIRMFMVTILYFGLIMIFCVMTMLVVMVMVMSCRCTSSWTGNRSLVAWCGSCFFVWMLVVWMVMFMIMPMPVTMAMAFVGG